MNPITARTQNAADPITPWRGLRPADREAMARDCAPIDVIPSRSAALAALAFGATLADYRAVLLAPSVAAVARDADHVRALAAVVPSGTMDTMRSRSTRYVRPVVIPTPVAPAVYRTGTVTPSAYVTGEGPGRWQSTAASVAHEATWDARAERLSDAARKRSDAIVASMRKKARGKRSGAVTVTRDGVRVAVIVRYSVVTGWSKNDARHALLMAGLQSGAVRVVRIGRSERSRGARWVHVDAATYDAIVNVATVRTGGDAARKAAERAAETPAQTEVRRAKDAERKRLKRAALRAGEMDLPRQHLAPHA